MNANLKWIGGSVVLGVLLVAALKPRERERYRGYDWPPELEAAQERYQAASSDLSYLKQIALRASAQEAARRVGNVVARSVTFRFESPVSAPAAARIERVLRNELATIAPTGPLHAIAVVVRVDSAAMGGIYYRSIVLPVTALQPCAVVVSLSPQGILYPTIQATDRLLGTCGFYAAFGRPGAAIERWLVESTMDFAAHFQPPAALGNDTASLNLMYGLDGSSIALASCSSGVPGACLEVLSPRTVPWEEWRWWWRPTREVWDQSRSAVPGTVSFSPGDASGRYWVTAGILSEVATDLGPERFGKLWRDERALAMGFEALEGRPLASEVATVVSRRLWPYHAGPGISAAATALSLVLIALSMLLGTRYARRAMT